MELGIDTFAAAPDQDGPRQGLTRAEAMRQLIDRAVAADQAGLDFFGVGEHHRPEYMDSAAPVILAAAAAQTSRIRLGSAVAVLSAIDPVRLFQQYATLDLVSNGRAEMVVGRGSFIDAFPLFGLDLSDYEALFEEKLELLLRLRYEEKPQWSGRFRPALSGQGVYPRPAQDSLPIWLGVGGTPASFARAGLLGLPLMVAILGGQPRRFAPLIDLYYRAAREAGHKPEQLRVGMHALGYVARTDHEARESFFPGYQRAFNKIGRERGWAPVTRAHFDAQADEEGALLVGSPETVAAKLQRFSKALGGLSRVQFQLDSAELSQEQVLSSISYLGEMKSQLDG